MASIEATYDKPLIVQQPTAQLKIPGMAIQPTPDPAPRVITVQPMIQQPAIPSAVIATQPFAQMQLPLVPPVPESSPSRTALVQELVETGDQGCCLWMTDRGDDVCLWAESTAESKAIPFLWIGSSCACLAGGLSLTLAGPAVSSALAVQVTYDVFASCGFAILPSVLTGALVLSITLWDDRQRSPHTPAHGSKLTTTDMRLLRRLPEIKRRGILREDTIGYYRNLNLPRRWFLPSIGTDADYRVAFKNSTIKHGFPPSEYVIPIYPWLKQDVSPEDKQWVWDALYVFDKNKNQEFNRLSMWMLGHTPRMPMPSDLASHNAACVHTIGEKTDITIYIDRISSVHVFSSPEAGTASWANDTLTKITQIFPTSHLRSFVQLALLAPRPHRALSALEAAFKDNHDRLKEFNIIISELLLDMKKVQVYQHAFLLDHLLDSDNKENFSEIFKHYRQKDDPQNLATVLYMVKTSIQHRGDVPLAQTSAKAIIRGLGMNTVSMGTGTCPVCLEECDTLLKNSLCEDSHAVCEICITNIEKSAFDENSNAECSASNCNAIVIPDATPIARLWYHIDRLICAEAVVIDCTKPDCAGFAIQDNTPCCVCDTALVSKGQANEWSWAAGLAARATDPHATPEANTFGSLRSCDKCPTLIEHDTGCPQHKCPRCSASFKWDYANSSPHSSVSTATRPPKWIQKWTTGTFEQRARAARYIQALDRAGQLHPLRVEGFSYGVRHWRVSPEVVALVPLPANIPWEVKKIPTPAQISAPAQSVPRPQLRITVV